mgnify:CR=1 FL=1
MLNTDKHPCFNVAVKGECGRVHLPVAPKCNILCNYCNRKYDCVNESRPGVTSGHALEGCGWSADQREWRIDCILNSKSNGRRVG